MANIDTFRSKISQRGGLSFQNRFEIFFPLPGGIKGATSEAARDINIFCESCTIPPKSFDTNEYSTGYGSTFKYPTGFGYDDVQFKFLLTNDYFIKNLFDNWMNFIIDPNIFLVKYKKEYVTDIKISQLDSEGNKVKTVVLLDAYPIGQSAITLDNSATNAAQSYTVDMTFADCDYLPEPTDKSPAQQEESVVENIASATVNFFRGLF